MLVLAAVGALYVALGARGPLERAVGALSDGCSGRSSGRGGGPVRGAPERSRVHAPGEPGYDGSMDRTHEHDDSQGQVSEVASMEHAGEEIDPHDAVAGAPDHSSGGDRAEEGTQGPDAPPRHGVPEESNESSR